MNWSDPIPTWLLLSLAYIGLWATMLGCAWLLLRAYEIAEAHLNQRRSIRVARKAVRKQGW